MVSYARGTGRLKECSRPVFHAWGPERLLPHPQALPLLPSLAWNNDGLLLWGKILCLHEGPSHRGGGGPWLLVAATGAGRVGHPDCTRTCSFGLEGDAEARTSGRSCGQQCVGFSGEELPWSSFVPARLELGVTGPVHRRPELGTVSQECDRTAGQWCLLSAHPVVGHRLWSPPG